MVLMCQSNSRYLGRADPARIAVARAARGGLIGMSFKRKEAGEVRYVLTEIPGNAAAQDAEMSLTDYEDWVFRAGFLHLPDPVGAWLRLREQQELVKKYMERKSVLRFRAPACDGAGGRRRHDGTDLTVDVSGRTWINHSGAENFPDGEVESGPRGVDGVVNFTFPSIYHGKEVDGVRLEFRAGRVVGASAAKNEDYLISLLDQDHGARNAGEIALGANYELKGFTKNAFFDEKIGGTFHLAVGAGYRETGNTNESALHWDLVCDLRPGGLIEADGEPVQKDGRFLFAGWPGN
jgi:aminopeptidase